MIRRGDANDTAFLRDMLRHAYYWRWEEPELRDLPVSRYVEGWGRPGDRALILIEGFQPVAARGTGCSRRRTPATASSTSRRPS